MSKFLTKDTDGNVVVFLQDNSTNLGKLGLVAADVSLASKDAGDATFVAKAALDLANATAVIGSLPDSQVTFSYPGASGNSFTVEVVAVSTPGTPAALSIVRVGSAITVNLAHDGTIPLATSANDAATIAAVVLTGFTLTASGTGLGILSLDEGPTSFAGGVDATFSEEGEGFYLVSYSSTETDTEGTLYTRVIGNGFKSTVVESEVVDNIPTTSTNTIASPPDTTVIFGTVLDAAGNPIGNASVSAQPTLVPSIINGAIISSNSIFTRTDSNGFFMVSLITGSQVDLYIPSVDFRRTITVPAESINLFCID